MAQRKDDDTATETDKANLKGEDEKLQVQLAEGDQLTIKQVKYP